MHVMNIIIGVLAVIGLGTTCCAIMLIVVLTRKGDEPDDEWHRLEDEEQIEYIKRWKENKNGRIHNRALEGTAGTAAETEDQDDTAENP